MSRFIPEHPKKGSAEAYAWAEKMRAAREKKARLKHTIRQAGLKTEQEFFGPGGPLAPKAIRKRKLPNPGAAWHEGMEQVARRYRKDAQSQTEKHIFAGMEIAHKDSAAAAKKLGMNPSRKMIDHGFYRISDKEAGRLSKTSLRGKLPSVGNEILIQDDDGTYKWLQRTPYAYREDSPSRGWVWSVRDSMGWIIDREKGRNILSGSGPSPRLNPKKNPIAIYNPADVAGTIYNNAIEIKAQKTGGPLKGHYKHVFGKNVKILGLKDGTVLLQHKDGKPLWITREEYERSGRHHH